MALAKAKRAIAMIVQEAYSKARKARKRLKIKLLSEQYQPGAAETVTEGSITGAIMNSAPTLSQTPAYAGISDFVPKENSRRSGADESFSTAADVKDVFSDSPFAPDMSGLVLDYGLTRSETDEGYSDESKPNLTILGGQQ